MNDQNVSLLTWLLQKQRTDLEVFQWESVFFQVSTIEESIVAALHT